MKLLDELTKIYNALNQKDQYAINNDDEDWVNSVRRFLEFSSLLYK